MKDDRFAALKSLFMLSATFMVICCLGYSMLPAGGNGFPLPMGGDEEEEELMQIRKQKYIDLIHRAAPGVNWRQVEEKNALNAWYRQKNIAGKTTTSFAGGAFNAVWYERGNDNQAGRMNSFAYLPSNNTLYAAADGGSIWRTTLPTVAWTKVADNASYNSYVLGAIPRSGTGARLLLSSGTKIWRTDNNGASFDTSAGISFPVPWGGNYIYRIIPVNDAAHTIYCVTFGWDAGSWTARFSLYSSTDSGLNFNYIRNFAYNNSNQLSFHTPLGSGTLYALGVSSAASDTLYAVNNSVVSTAGVTTSIASGDNLVDMKSMVSGGVTHFYAITGGTHIYHSTNMGANWLLKSTVGPDNSIILGLSAQSPNAVFYGNIEAHRSTDSGANWSLINTWGSYYSAVATKLHADLRDFSFFKYSSGAEFGIIGNDGGAYISNDLLATVSNLSMTGLHVNQLWDHMTSPADTNIIIGGSQDQGLQATSTGGGSGIITQQQVISGDYGQMRITGNGNILWPQYPGGNIYLYKNLATPAYVCTWSMTGTQKPNVGWMLATSDHYTSASQDQILIGGGEISGDSGSYLVRLTLPTGASTVTPFQYSYNFRLNSNNARSGIAAIGISKLSNSLMYVAAEDGTFFYSNDAGTSWTKTAAFPGVYGSYLYGSTILASVDSVNKLYYGGSGYSNPGVYVSRDHGVTFDSMSNGLPPTLVNKLAAYSNDSFIFAATEAGPYIYVKAANMWYSLAEPRTPVVNWRSVEYIPSIKTVRFGTYGRGIWDLRMDRPISYVGINTPKAAADYTIAPNPARSGAPVTVFGLPDQQITLNIYTTNGRKVFSGKTMSNSPLTMPDLPPSVYICEVNDGTIRQNSLITVN
ncbi:MAG: T9SS type A sorting domain-containing protein [Taibaiella sp.]|nr:T9SS type A sorting domain-containing protein [Taibaiella sp.]